MGEQVISEKYDASAPVDGGRPDGGMGDYIDSLRDDCGLIIGSVLWAVKKFCHRDLLAELLEPISGDFNAISSMQKGWLQVASATSAVGDNYESLRSQIDPVLDGQAATAIDSILTRIAEAHDGQQEAAELIAEQLGNMLRCPRPPRSASAQPSRSSTPASRRSLPTPPCRSPAG